ncbi:thioredoxin domain-containing protein 8 isoform X2 [Orcinus orca]|uniref:thioredoxin domain-containing protein 8 isoform X2 n=1 Tax=Orcinus orca TaxID=9733 RepID=UPI002113212C|nr:thioredoxin domain-containing protein 8 isoform X2 [Orcinus orca]
MVQNIRDMEMSVQYRNVLFASVDVDDARELAQIYHIKAMPTFQMFKQAQKVTLFSRIKRAICCYRSGSLSEPIFELCGTDAKKLEEKIRELINYLNLPLGTQGRSWRLNEAYFQQTRNGTQKGFCAQEAHRILLSFKPFASITLFNLCNNPRIEDTI